MRTSSLCLFLSAALFLFPHAARTAEPGDAELLEKLRDDDFDERQTACAKLIERGDAVRALVTAELAKPDIDPDYKTHLKAVAAGLRELDVLKAFDAPRRIDLDLKNDTVSDALEEITAHFSQTVTAKDAAGDKRVTFSIKGATFMEAVNAVRNAAGLRFAPSFSTGAYYSENDERFKTLALAMPANAGPPCTAASGPFAVVLSNIESRSMNADRSFIMLSGVLYTDRAAAFSRLKFATIKAVDGDKEYIVASGVPANIVQFFRVWSGKTPESGSILCGFSSASRSADLPPSGLTWKLVLGVEVPLKTVEEQVEIDAAQFGAQQTLTNRLLTIQSLQLQNDEWALICTLSGGMNNGLPGQRLLFANMSEGPPGGTRGQTSLGIRFLDEQGKPLAWRQHTRNIIRENGSFAYRLEMRLERKPKNMIFSRIEKTASREFEFEIPAVPVPLTREGER